MDHRVVEERVRGIPWMLPWQGRRIYEHVRTSGPEAVLELGTEHGVSAAYIAAALDENGGGLLTTVDRRQAMDPTPEELLDELGLREHVRIVRRPDSSYDWFLKQLIEQRSDDHGNCEPLFDLCYLDGAHNFTIDGLAVFLVEKLLRPGGWLLLDDLDWTYGEGGVQPPSPHSDEELAEPHMEAVFELLVKQHPSFTEFRIENDVWGWAKKDPGAPRRYALESSEPLAALVATLVRQRVKRLLPKPSFG